MTGREHSLMHLLEYGSRAPLCAGDPGPRETLQRNGLVMCAQCFRRLLESACPPLREPQRPLGEGRLHMVRKPKENGAGDGAGGHERRVNGGSALAPVLVLGEDAHAAEALVGALRRAGYPVLASDDGRKGVELVETLGPAVIVLDLATPGLDASAFLSRLPRTGRGSEPRVVVVAGEWPEDLEADVVLTKPVDPADVVAAVAGLVRRASVH